MNISYNDQSDVLYIRLDDQKQDVINKRITDEIVLDLGKDDRIVGIEILDASKRIALNNILPVRYAATGV